MVHDGNCLGLLPIILDVWLFVTMKICSSEMVMQFQLLNYSNPYFQLKVEGDDYYCVYTFHTWNPRHAVHYKCRLSFTAVIIPDPSNGPPMTIGTKLISVPLNGPLRGIIDFTKALSLDLCVDPLDCNETTWAQPLNLIFDVRPWWIKILVTHHGALTDKHNRFVAVDQSFLVDQFDINVTDVALAPWSDDTEDDEPFRARNRALMTSLAYKLSLQCSPNFYGDNCDLKNCFQTNDKARGMLLCEKNSRPHYICSNENEPCSERRLKATAELNENNSNLFKLATFILAFIAALEAFIIFIDIYLRRLR